MGKESFMDSNEALTKIVTASKSSFTDEDLLIRLSEEYQNCRIEFIPWDRKYGSVSIPITKSSPYEPFMRQAFADIYSTGALQKLQQKWLKTEHQCENAEVKPISPQKVITCFIWILGGMISSVLTIIVEKLIFKCKKVKNVSQSNARDAMNTRIRNIVDDLFQQKDIPDEEMVHMFVSAANEKIMKAAPL